jgi:glycerate 2-kinase
MERKIKNHEEIMGHGDKASRRIILDITEATLQYLDAYERIKSIAHLDQNTLRIGTRSWDLSRKRNVFLVGAGKACNAMAMAFDSILGDRLTKGIAIVKIPGEADVFNKTEGRRSGPSRRLGSSLELKSASGPTDARVVGAQRRFSIPTEGVSQPSAIIGFS